MIVFDIRLFGAIEIRRNGELLTGFRSQKALVLLAYLICEKRSVTRDYLAGLGWPEAEQGQALGLLRRSLHDLNRQLPGCLDLDGRTVRFHPAAPVTVDLQQFVGLANQPDPQAWAQAVALYRAPFLHGIYLADAPELENWLVRAQERWQSEVVRLLNQLAAYHGERASYQPALNYTQHLLAIEPWREEAHRQAMLFLARLGQTSAALAQYERCRDALQTELAVEPAQETERLRTRLAAIAHSPTHPLPPATTPFIGRSAEVAELTQWLASPQSRLITLVGPGGMGKTRLALAMARTVLTEQRRIFLHGVVFVPLVGVETLPQTVAALGQALAFPFQSQGAPETQLLHYLRDKELLLVLDNFEQLVNEPILDFVRQLLNSAPDLKLLITSRVRLNLHGEQLYWMQGLSVPVTTAATALPNVADMATYSSVQLFLSTVQRSRPHYTLTTADVPAVMTICQQVQGMPLALELAATWMSVLTPTEIATELTRSLDFLASDLHDLPLRQRSMRAVFATSWRLLTPGEQQIFAQLSVFRGSFTREAAQAVTGASLPVLVRLLHTSFLQQSTDGRYQIHELLRQFGEEKLAETPTRQATTQDRHSHYYLTFVTQRAAGLQGPQQPVLLNEIGQEIDNIRHGWLWAAEQGNFALIDSALDGLYDYYQTRSQQASGIELFARTIQMLQGMEDNGVHRRLLCHIQARQGAFACEIGEYQKAYQLLQTSLAEARQRHEHREIAFCLEFIGRTIWWQEGEMAALPLLEESLAISHSLGDLPAIAITLHTLASAYDTAVEKLRAREVAEQSLALSQQLGHTHRIAAALHRLGSIAVGLGEYDAAVEYFQQAVTAFKRLGDRYHIVLTVGELGRAMYMTGKFPPAIFMAVLHEAATHGRALGTYHGLFLGVGAFAYTAICIGDYATGERIGHELVAASQQMPPSFLASCLIVLGEAEVGLGKLKLARQHLLEAMHVMLKSQTRLFVNFRLVLKAWADLLYAEGTHLEKASQFATAERKWLAALEIVACVLHQPQVTPFYKTHAALVATELKQRLPVDLALAAEAHGQHKTLSQLIAEIIQQEGKVSG